MEGGKSRSRSSPPQRISKFTVYQNPSLSATLTFNSLLPSKLSFFFILSLSTASAFFLLCSFSRDNGMIDTFKVRYVSEEIAYLFTKVIQTMLVSILLGTVLALIKVISLWKSSCTRPSSSKGSGQTCLTNRQLALVGIKPKVELTTPEFSKKPPKSKFNSGAPLDVLVPLHQLFTTPKGSSLINGEKSSSSSGSKMHLLSTPSNSPISPSLYLVSGGTSQSSSVQASPGLNTLVASPWSNKRSTCPKDVVTVEELEQFLVDVDKKISESASKLATPPSMISGFGMATPTTIASSTNIASATRSTPLRSIRMSPGSQKFSTPPKKGEGDLPPPMSMEEAIEAFDHLGIYPQIEEWRDRLRQWFSSNVLNPLLNKIKTSHIKVMQAAAKLGFSIKINPLGSDLASLGGMADFASIELNSEWQPAYTLDEEGLLHQLSGTLIQALDSSMSKLPLANLQQQQTNFVTMLQECIDAITEHQRLHALIKGEWVKGLLPQSSVREDYTVQRIQELAEGTCVKNYEYLGSSEVYDKANKKWTLELPTDSHLMLYLFCAFLEHPKWMLHVDPAGSQSSKNPLFLGVLPPKERFPEKYLGVVSGLPSVLHPGACVLAVGKQSHPIFALYWDKKAQFSLQGRTALWDSILLLCHRIKVSYGGIVRGMHLGSSAFGIRSVIDPKTED